MSADLEQIEYRTLTPLAVVGLILGLCSPLAFLSTLLVIVPLLGIVVSLAALRRIASSDGSVIGRPAAVVGLVLSTICASAIPAQAAGMRWLMNRQAQPIAKQWFDLLAEGNPHEALELKSPPQERRLLGSALPEYYASDETAYKTLQDFVNDPRDPTVHTLLALGDKATVRYYDDAGFGRMRDGRVQIAQIYAVTFPDPENEKPTTFFVQLALEKYPAIDDFPGGWRVLESKGGVRPE